MHLNVLYIIARSGDTLVWDYAVGFDAVRRDHPSGDTCPATGGFLPMAVVGQRWSCATGANPYITHEIVYPTPLFGPSFPIGNSTGEIRLPSSTNAPLELRICLSEVSSIPPLHSYQHRFTLS